MLIYATEGADSKKLAHRLLAYAMSEQQNLTTLPEIKKGNYGKPFFPTMPSVHFNLTHSGKIAMCALSDTPIGIDVQETRAWRESLLNRACSAQERAWLLSWTDAPSAFSLLWALKESYGKYSGKGLSWPVKSILVPLPPFPAAPQHPYLLSSNETLQHCVFGGTDWQGAVCSVDFPPEKIIWIEQNALL